MRNRHLLLTLLFCLCAYFSNAQSQDAAVKGKVTDEATGEELPYAFVVITQGGAQKAVKQTDLDGLYRFEGLQPGAYDISVKLVGYKAKMVQNVILIGDKTQYLDIKLSSGTLELNTFTFVQFKKALFEKDQTTTTNTLTREQVARAPVKGVGYLAATSSGTYQGSNGLSIAGGRSNGTVYYVDGVKISGTSSGGLNVPQSDIEQLSVITAGLPAEYGDAIGGVVTVTTRGPASKLSGGIEGISSQFLDPYGYNNFEGFLSGPLLKTKSTDPAHPSRTVLGYFLAGGVTLQKDPSPAGINLYQVNDDVLKNLEENPLRQQAPIFSNGVRQDNFVSNATYVTKDQIHSTPIHVNDAQQNYNLSGKIDFQPYENINVTAGGAVNYLNQKNFNLANSLFNSDNNGFTTDQIYRGFIRYKQSFKSDSGSIIQNSYYSIQADYTTNIRDGGDSRFKNDYFKYGYIGKFDVFSSRVYGYDFDYTSKTYGSYLEGGYRQDSVHFSPGNVNTVSQNYTRQYFAQKGSVRSMNQVLQEGALRNGDQPGNVNSLWAGLGQNAGSSFHLQRDQFNLYFTAAANIKNHALKFGINYEQQLHRLYQVSNTNGLWTIARQLANSHLTIASNATPTPVYDQYGNFLDTFNYKFSSANQSNFDRNFRNSLISKGERDSHGKLINDQSYINIDKYDPSYFKMNMFSADELLSNGYSLIYYYGTDYLGNKSSGKVNVNNFLNDSTNRWIAPYQPIYVAGFIQDKFEFHDITFRVGLRVDRFDANQPVLNDAYSLYPTRTVGEINGKTFGSTKFVKPGNIGDNYVPYVNDPINPTSTPIGFRDPVTNKWYDANGKAVTDVTYLSTLSNSGQLTPYLANGATKDNMNKPIAASFKNYTPQVTYSPRVSFSFPISQEAVFYANYDILTQRPKGVGTAVYNLFNITDYYYLKERATGTIDNPDLKPEKRINYEVGFKQKLSDVSALTMQAFYGEIRDMVQVRKVAGAFPVPSYTTFDNIDFGTVKGLTLIYDQRRKTSQGVEFNLNYTLQFANGTGSEATSSGGLLAAGYDNLRVPLPLDYDVRHNINSIIDYRFGVGPEYSGPTALDTSKKLSIIANKVYHAIFENAGFFFVVSAHSGTPYSSQSNVTQDVSIGVSQRRTMFGDPNGARLPWNYRLDFTFDKNINIKSNKTQANNGGNGGERLLNVYVTVQNLLNTANIVSVYRYTGLPNDDGFLSSAEGQKTLSNISNTAARQAYNDQYALRVNDPGHYGAPRIIRLGLRYSF